MADQADDWKMAKKTTGSIAELLKDAKTETDPAVKRIMVYLPEDEYQEFRDFCGENRISMTRAARIAVKYMMDNV